MSQVVYDMKQGAWHVPAATEPLFGIPMGGGYLVNTHGRDKCEGQYCVLHNPSPHHMREWSIVWRGDKGVFERQCPHGIGHPDPDDAAFLIRIGKSAWTSHGCDGCCSKEEV